ncbi:glucose-1-phosphate cytidylyltransferase [Lachnospiraceae bacterium]|nr:glucose-1-phosphate cytidylyltransferase [Lachnospiraceae bacterium]
MKVIILAGGLGTRISEESHLKPKPMIEIGEQPILWHIMKYFSTYKFNEFIILAGYKQNKIKEYFANYFVYNSDVTFYMANNSMEVHHKTAENWKVTVLDTGLNTMTGGRVKRAKEYIGNEPFMLTYGDGVADVDLNALQDFHNKHGKIATITTVSLAQQKGVLEKEENGLIKTFREKSIDDAAMINGGYMLLNPDIFNYIEGDTTVFEQTTLNRLAEEE